MQFWLKWEGEKSIALPSLTQLMETVNHWVYLIDLDWHHSDFISADPLSLSMNSYLVMCPTRLCYCVVHQRMNANGFIAMWFILLKQSRTMIRYLHMWHRALLLFTYRMAVIHSITYSVPRWVLVVTPDSSSSLPGCSMGVLPPPLLLINCLSCSPLGGPGPPPSTPPCWPHFPQGPGIFLLHHRLQVIS